jgi:hypothetical protein
MAVGHWWDDTGLGARRPVDMRDHKWSTRSLWLWPVWLCVALVMSRSDVAGGWVAFVAFGLPAGIWIGLLARETNRLTQAARKRQLDDAYKRGAMHERLRQRGLEP